MSISQSCRCLLLATVLLLGCNEKQAPASSISELAARWPANCKKLKKRLGPAADVRFSKLPTTLGTKPDWSLALRGLHIGLPQARYDVFVTRSLTRLTVILRAGKRVVLLSEDPPAKPLEDVLGKVGEVPAARRIEFTRALYGKLPTMYDVMSRAYRYGRSDLRCSTTKIKEAIPMGIGLVLKGMTPMQPGSLRVYDQPFGLPRTIATAGHMGADLWAMDFHIERPQRSHLVTYRVPRAEEAQALPSVRVSLQPATGAKPSPLWLLALRGALDRPDDAARWKALHGALATRGADARAQSTIAKLAEESATSAPTSAPTTAPKAAPKTAPAAKGAPAAKTAPAAKQAVHHTSR